MHRSALGLEPSALWTFFELDSEIPPPRGPRRHCRHLRDPSDVAWPDYALRSALGGVRLYNLLPEWAIETTSVASFQRRLTRLVRARVCVCDDWQLKLSWRVPLAFHPQRSLRDWRGENC